MTTSRATLVGALAILLWSALALLTTAAGAIPPFELMALSFGVAFTAALARTTALGAPAWRRLRQPRGAWALCVGALSLYHALYFFALRAAPAAQASLIAYLWPLLIVLFSAMAPGFGLRARHIIGAVLGLAGTALLVLGGQPGSGVAGGATTAWGEIAAGACAIVWSGYSVLNRRYAFVPVDVVAMACGPVALVGFAGHLALESSVAPSPTGWGAVVALGLGPVGLAFVAWDHATKHGSLPILGALSYLAPLASTLLLVAAGQAAPGAMLFTAAGMILAGAAIAASGARRASLTATRVARAR